MIPIPPYVQSLLQTKDFEGEDRPAATVTIEGQPASENLKDPTNWTTWRAFTTAGKGHGNIAETVDKQCIVAYVENGDVFIAYAPTVVGILEGSETFDYIHAVKIFDNPMNDNCAVSLNLIDGIFNLAICYHEDRPVGPWPDYHNQILEIWRDTDGNGNGFVKRATIRSGLRSQAASLQPTFIQKLGNGTLFVGAIYGIDFGHEGYFAHSSDDGLTWSYIGDPRAYWLGHTVSMRSLQLDDDQFLSTCLGSSGGATLNRYFNSGAEVSTDDFWDGDWGGGGSGGGNPTATAWLEIGNDILFVNQEATSGYKRIYTKKVVPPEDMEDVIHASDWDYITEIGSDGSFGATSLTAANEAIICQHCYGGIISGAGTLLEPGVPLPVMSITVDRSKGSASQATVLIDNKDGMFAPDNINSPWFQTIWPNKIITITMGYGVNQQLVFKGFIDEITMNNYASNGATLEIVARDFSKRALDQMAQMYVEVPYPHIAYVLLFQWQTPEYIFRELAKLAGWADDKIHTEVTGLTLPEFKTPHEQYADSFQRLAEIAGFEWFTDEPGEIYYRKAVEPTPTVLYTFVEGENLFKLGYKFSDSELYYDVVVWSMTSTDPEDNPVAVRATVTWSAAPYNKVLPQKTLIVQAADIVVTEEGCQEIAQRLADAITPKPRSVDCAVIGNPYLQMGDCVQVIESSSTISELYRIFEMTHQFDMNSGNSIFNTSFKCYHYAYVPG